MSSSHTRPRSYFGAPGAAAILALSALSIACPGNLDPALLDGSTTGSAGSNPSGGAGGSSSPDGAPCDAKPTLAGVCGASGCHNPTDDTKAAGLDLMSANVATRLLDKTTYGTASNGSACMTNTSPYLKGGSNPATGLLLDKISNAPPCGSQMPLVGSLSTNQLNCIKSWATGITTGVITE